MNKYTIGAIALGIMLVGLMFITSKNSEPIKTTDTISAAEIVVLEEPFSFGDIDIFGGKVSTTYTLKNEGTEDVTITGASTSCMCTEGEIAGLTFGMHGSDVTSILIPSGGEEVVTATFDPLAHGPEGTGPITRELMLETNSSETPDIRLKFSGNVIKN